MQEDRKESRFIKSFKYKHKGASLGFCSVSAGRPAETLRNESPNSSCDILENHHRNRKCTSRKVHAVMKRRRRRRFKLGGGLLWPVMVILLQLIFLLLFAPARAFCPFKCFCDDQSLSANCTQAPSITIIPMTFNPLLRQLTLNHLPMTELLNSLSVYRQLEYLNLNSNLLRQIKYQNFNFKPAPPSVLLVNSNSNNNSPLQQQPSARAKQHPSYGASVADTTNQRPASGQFDLTNANNEQLARHLKQAIDKSVSSSASAGAANSNSEDEIGFHLRDLDLGDNRIDQLGSLSELELDEAEQFFSPADQQLSGPNFRLRSTQLERLAPFLTLTKLENLNLGGNRLARLHQHVFLGLVNLKRLDLSRNQLEFIDRYAFVGLIELELLKLNHNKLANQLPPLSMALCRAPMMELRFLDLSANLRTSAELEVLLPNQMFICSPRLVSLRLDSLQLRYIQVNAFDNLQQLETLNLSHNYLEQVPSDPLSYSNSNLSQSLRQLDLSDNLIEFVESRSFGALRNLQKLCLNSMERLVSFDLSSLSVHYSLDEDTGQQLSNQQRELINDPAAAAAAAVANGSSLLPVWPAPQIMPPNSINLSETNSSPTTINHGNEVQLINDQLIELQLRQNPRLQWLHSSLAARSEPPRGRIRFARLRLLDLAEAVELRDFALDQMIELAASAEEGAASDSRGRLPLLRLDLAQVNKLNCSSCQMSWLLEAAKQQRRTALPVIQFADQPSGWPPASPYGQLGAPSRHTEASRVILEPDKVGCQWPFQVSLMQLVELEATYASSFPPQDRSCQQQQGLAAPASGVAPVNRQVGELALSERPPHSVSQPTGGGQQTATTGVGSLWLAALLALVLVGVLARLGLVLLARRRRRQRPEFKWRSPPPSLAASSIESPGSSSRNPTNSPLADCSSSSILSATANGQLFGHQPAAGSRQLSRLVQSGQLIYGAPSNQPQAVRFGQCDPAAADCRSGLPTQIERAHRRAGNLFSRIAGRLSGRAIGGWRPASAIRRRRVPQRLARAATGPDPQATTCGTRVIENMAAHGGDDKMLADHYSSAIAAPGGSFRPAANHLSGQLAAMVGSGAFIKPAYCGQAPAASQLLECNQLVYANCLAAQEAGRSSGGPEEPTSYSSGQLADADPDELLGDSPAANTCRQQRQQLWRLQGGHSSESSSRAPQRQPTQLANSQVQTVAYLATNALSPAHQQQPATDDRGAILLDGHIYVTLDRPIKQQNGRDEYECHRANRPQQQQHRPQQRELQPAPEVVAAAEVGAARGPVSRPSAGGQLASLVGRRPSQADEYKSFEWVGGECALETAGDKFKQQQQATESMGESLGRQLAGQLGGKLSAPFWGPPDKEPLESHRDRTSGGGRTGELPPEMTTQKGVKRGQFAPTFDPLPAAATPCGLTNDQVYDKNGNNNNNHSDLTRQQQQRDQVGRKSWRSRRRDVTGHSDYHDDDDVAQRAAAAAAAVGSERQLFMDLNGRVETTNEPVGPSKWEVRSGPLEASPCPPLDVTSSAAHSARHKTGGGKYDANHGPIYHERRTSRPATSDNSHRNCVINGLQSQQCEGSGGGGQSATNRLRLGVARGLSSGGSDNNGSKADCRLPMTNESSIVIGQRDFVATSSPPTSCQAAPGRQEQQQLGKLLLQAEASSDYLLGQQKLCDIAASRAAAAEASAVISGHQASSAAANASDLPPGSGNGNSNYGTGKLAAANEIYSNQFYYCRPSQADERSAG